MSALWMEDKFERPTKSDFSTYAPRNHVVRPITWSKVAVWAGLVLFCLAVWAGCVHLACRLVGA